MRIAALALAYCAWLGLCLAMTRHHRQIWTSDARPGRRALLRALGWISMGLSLGCSVLAVGWAVGPVEWLGTLSVTALALVLLLPYAPRAALWLGAAGLTLASIVLLL